MFSEDGLVAYKTKYPLLLSGIKFHNLTIIAYLIDSRFTSNIKWSRTMQVMQGICRQLPFSRTGVVMNIIQFLHDKLFCSAFLYIKWIFPYFVYFSPGPIFCLHPFLLPGDYIILSCLFQPVHYFVSHKPFTIPYHRIQWLITSGIVQQDVQMIRHNNKTCYSMSPFFKNCKPVIHKIITIR